MLRLYNNDITPARNRVITVRPRIDDFYSFYHRVNNLPNNWAVHGIGVKVLPTATVRRRPLRRSLIFLTLFWGTARIGAVGRKSRAGLFCTDDAANRRRILSSEAGGDSLSRTQAAP